LEGPGGRGTGNLRDVILGIAFPLGSQARSSRGIRKTEECALLTVVVAGLRISPRTRLPPAKKSGVGIISIRNKETVRSRKLILGKNEVRTSRFSTHSRFKDTNIALY
jgi:hypothetical protein